jgi:hypothetical protein
VGLARGGLGGRPREGTGRRVTFDLGDDSVRYAATSEVDLSIGGRGPLELLSPDGGRTPAGDQPIGAWAATAVFQVSADDLLEPLTFTRRFVAVPAEDDLPVGAPTEIRRTQRVRLD